MYSWSRTVPALVLVMFLASAVLAADIDSDGIPDVLDKCAWDSRNATHSCDTDSDGYGNVCDGDFNQSFATNVIDQCLALAGPGHCPSPGAPVFPRAPSSVGDDMDCNGTVDAADYDLFLQNFDRGGPGPSGLACAGVPGCQ
jgi:hypothetical protein